MFALWLSALQNSLLITRSNFQARLGYITALFGQRSNYHLSTESVTIRKIYEDEDQADFNISHENTATLRLGRMSSSDHYEFLLSYIIN